MIRNKEYFQNFTKYEKTIGILLKQSNLYLTTLVVT